MNSGPTISAGSTGADVHRLQVLLVEMKLLDPSGIDGDFGPHTDASVRSFQEGAGLGVDGIVGPLTWAALPVDPVTPQLRIGDNGLAVAALQQGLAVYGNQDPSTNPGAIDGDFGPMTDAAVRAYQSDRGVGVDGIVGDQTWWVPAGAAGATLASLAGLTTI
jgi:peptidoglycan hydrolase-like protein with peptidoglycan-binding domain